MGRVVFACELMAQTSTLVPSVRRVLFFGAVERYSSLVSGDMTCPMETKRRIQMIHLRSSTISNETKIFSNETEYFQMRQN